MLKRDELTDPNSCLNKAQDDEPLFVLLGRDEEAPGVVLEWCAGRVLSGKNRITDTQIQSAIDLATAMGYYHKRLNK